MSGAVRAVAPSVTGIHGQRRRHAFWRIGWTVLTIVVVEGLVCGAALLPVVVIWWQVLALSESPVVLRAIAISLLVVPMYVLFALILMCVSGLIVRALNWRTPPHAEMRIADVDWVLLQWIRGMVVTHIVRVFAGTLFRGSPVWTAYLRLAGARLGRRVYVNSLAVTDYNLLEFGDDVVIGDDVHVSGHTVEGGVVKTAPLRLGNNVTIGLGSVIEIGVEAGEGCQVGALSFVPKDTKLQAHTTYAGIPAERLHDGC